MPLPCALFPTDVGMVKVMTRGSLWFGASPTKGAGRAMGLAAGTWPDATVVAVPGHEYDHPPSASGVADHAAEHVCAFHAMALASGPAGAERSMATDPKGAVPVLVMSTARATESPGARFGAGTVMLSADEVPVRATRMAPLATGCVATGVVTWVALNAPEATNGTATPRAASAAAIAARTRRRLAGEMFLIPDSYA